MSILSFDDFVSAAKSKKTRLTVSVAGAHEKNTLEAALRAEREGIANVRLIGDSAKIRSIIAETGANPRDFDIIHTNNREETLGAAVRDVQEGRSAALMKGAVETADFLRVIVKNDNGLRGEGRLSAIGLYNPAAYHKLIAVSDFGMNTTPDLSRKLAIIENAVSFLNSIGIAKPKTAVLSDTEKVNPAIPASADAGEIKRLWEAGKIKDCILEAPIAFDLAVSREAAEIKEYASPVAGDADLLVVPDIVAGNILVKAITLFARVNTAGIVLGAAVPVIMPSRSAPADDKFYSIALAAAADRRDLL